MARRYHGAVKTSFQAAFIYAVLIKLANISTSFGPFSVRNWNIKKKKDYKQILPVERII